LAQASMVRHMARQAVVETEAISPTNVEWPNTDLESDLYGLSTCALVRDLTLFAQHKGHRLLHQVRLGQSILLLVACLVFQKILLNQVLFHVCNKAVHDIRMAYSDFEQKVYEGHMVMISSEPFPQFRGLGGVTGPHFNASVFHELDLQEQAEICRIPLTQPPFIMTVLFIWTLTCVAEFRKARDMFYSIVVNTERTESMLHSMVQNEDASCDDSDEMVIARLTRSVKALLFCLVILPRVYITGFLLWIGCRLLVATSNFSDVLLNACALEFILLLKDLLYLVCVPRKTAYDLDNTKLMPSQLKEPDSLRVFLGATWWAVFALAVVFGYIGVHFGPGSYVNGVQVILPEYQWDAHVVCQEWVAIRYEV